MAPHSSSSSASRLLRRASNAARLLVVIPLASAYMAAEYFVLLLRHREKILRSEYVTLLWFWSFGHQAVDPHMLAMRFRGKKLLILLSDYQNFNPYLIETFRQYVDILFLRHSWCMRKLRPLLRWSTLKALKLRVLRFFLRLQRSNAVVVPEYHERQGSILEGTFITERIQLFERNADMPIIPLAEPIARCRRLLREAHPELANMWFVSLYLRKTDKPGDEMRDTDPATFRVVIDRVRELGGFVFCGGDYRDPHALFPEAQGLIGYGDLPCERELADYFFITQCRFLVSANSGPVAIAISFNVPTLITNCSYFYYSGSRANQITLYRKLRDRATGRILAARETCSLPIVAYRKQPEFERAGLEHIDNAAEEIAEALEEMVQRHILGKEIVTREHQALYDRYRSLLPQESVAFRSPSRPALSYLQKLQW